MSNDDVNDILSQLIVRDYNEGDHPGVMALWEATGLGHSWRGDDAGVIARSIEMGGKLLVAELPRGPLVGTSWMTFDGRRIHLHHVGVLPRYRRRGIGRLLSVESIRYAREKGIKIKLEVHRDNQAAIALYRSLGFEYLGDYDVYIIRSFDD